MASVSMSPDSTQYLTPFIESNHLLNAGVVDLELASDVALTTFDRRPQAITTGNIIIYLRGELQVVNQSLDMPLLIFPDELIAANPTIVSCPIQLTPQDIQSLVVRFTDVGLSGISTPSPGAIFYFDSIFYNP